MIALNTLLLGAIAMGSLIAALFFIRFWMRTHDRFFAFFSIAFVLEAVNRIALALYWESEINNPIYFCIRLASYSIIIFAIIDKNWGKKNRSR
jgi:uncharacterized membrane protein